MPTKRQSQKRRESSRIYVLASRRPQPDAGGDIARRLGFDGLLVLGADPADPSGESGGYRVALAGVIEQARDQGLVPWADVRLDGISSAHDLVSQRAPAAFAPVAPVMDLVDPRRPFETGDGLSRLRRPEDQGLIDWWVDRLTALEADGVQRFVYRGRGTASRALAARLRGRGHAIDEIGQATDAPAPCSAIPLACDTAGPRLIDRDRKRAMLAATAASASAWAMAAGFELGVEDEVSGVNRLMAARATSAAPRIRALTGSGAALRIALSESANTDVIFARNGSFRARAWPPTSPPLDEAGALVPIAAFEGGPGEIAPGETLLFQSRPRPAVARHPDQTANEAAESSARIVIEAMSPSLDGGAFAIKRVVDEPIAVNATIFTDGHAKIAAALLTKADDDEDWTRTPMSSGPNDLWSASARLPRVGRHVLVVEAWLDVWGGFVHDLVRKQDAGLDVTLELREARALIEAARGRAKAGGAKTLGGLLRRLERSDAADQLAILTGPGLAKAMAEADARPFLTRGPIQPVEVERVAARYASWYELFPRSQSPDGARHGTFADVVARLPQIAAMGFDTLYFPPIHPIGIRNRKGPNNSLNAGPLDLGSPYAIGGPDGGHTDIHPALGTLEDFRDLVVAAHRHGLEIALDFAVQCAPDHPWITEHPDWFDWRPDGSIKYAENPPKTYQDIVNVDFYRPGAVPALWEALRDVVLFWAAQGVKAFRVDNPHTKPMPFWRWMIAEVKARHPDALFLAEAFTRPAPMRYLAKIGFSQSYTYFTWRHSKAELTAYLTELTQTPLKEFFRPHFFVNTPDINPVFLQTSGRAGFLIRAALAATLSGLFGVYAGFELCEAAPLPGREEYLDSEKYEIRRRPDRASGDIVDEISQLNAIRRAEPALQTHLGVAFHTAFNDQILFYSKSAPGQDGLILVAVSLDPHRAQEADIEVPLWLLGLADHDGVEVEDLLTGRRFRWTGKIQHVRLPLDQPYALWRLSAREDV